VSGSSDSLDLAKALIRRPSITPEDAGAIDVLQAFLDGLGFQCHPLVFSEPGTEPVRNLYARIGTDQPNFCFAGHTDVVPPGPTDSWSTDPFDPQVRDGYLYGRGSSDMKAAVACFAVAVERFLTEHGGSFPGSISLLITGDEEGDAVNGTRKVLGWMRDRGEIIDQCLVGEPTSDQILGDMAKIGRRGSMNAWISVFGTQGHSAYPHLADNPVPRLLTFLSAVDAHVLDKGTDFFPPSNLEITTIDVGNTATNVIPERAEARINIRFNDRHSGASLTEFLEDKRRKYAGDSEMTIKISGEAFLTPPGLLSDIVAEAIRGETGTLPELSTTGGTSDARFIKDFCPVVEFGVSNATAHKSNECVALDDVEALTRIYQGVLDRFFENNQ